MASTEKSFTESGSSVTYGATAAAYRYKYDENNRLIQLTHTVNGTTWSTGYTYDADGIRTEKVINGVTATERRSNTLTAQRPEDRTI